MVEFHSIASDFRVHATCMRWARSQSQEHIEYCVIVLYVMDCFCFSELCPSFFSFRRTSEKKSE